MSKKVQRVENPSEDFVNKLTLTAVENAVTIQLEGSILYLIETLASALLSTANNIIEDRQIPVSEQENFRDRLMKHFYEQYNEITYKGNDE